MGGGRSKTSAGKLKKGLTPEQIRAIHNSPIDHALAQKWANEQMRLMGLGGAQLVQGFDPEVRAAAILQIRELEDVFGAMGELNNGTLPGTAGYSEAQSYRAKFGVNSSAYASMNMVRGSMTLYQELMGDGASARKSMINDMDSYYHPHAVIRGQGKISSVTNSTVAHEYFHALQGAMYQRYVKDAASRGKNAQTLNQFAASTQRKVLNLAKKKYGLKLSARDLSTYAGYNAKEFFAEAGAKATAMRLNKFRPSGTINSQQAIGLAMRDYLVLQGYNRA